MPDVDLKLFFILLFFSKFSGVWNGFACLSNPCVHGVCLDDLNSTYFCYCIDGYTGIQCQTNWNECWSNPCQNGGTCVDGIAMFNCTCPPGFLGDLCEEDLNECESNPCQNNGTCVDAPNGYNCNCHPGYSGIHCEIDIAVCNTTNETRCFNGGTCEEGPGESFSCKCQPGWEGQLCDSEINECRSSPCQNGAICIDLHATYACACLFGFAGHNCEEIVQVCDKNPCKNGALCLLEEGLPSCYCVPDFHGDLCQFQYDECQLGPKCTNGGTCIDGIDKFTCSCPPNLTGLLCECLMLEDNELDCTFVAPSTTTMSTVLTTLTTIVPNTTEYTTLTILNDSSTMTTTTKDYPITITTDCCNDTSTETTTILTTVTTFETTKIPEVPTSTTTETSTSPIITTSTTMVTETSTTTTTTTTEISTSTIEVTTIPDLDTTTVTLSTFLTEEPRQLTDATTTTTTAPTTTTTKTTTTTTPSTTTTTATTITTPTTTTIPTDLSLLSTTTDSTISIDCTKADSRCQNGGTCIYTDAGYKCICPFDTEGLHCQINLGVRIAAFNGQSFLSHRLTNYSHIDVEIEAKTLASSGLLFYSNIDTTYMALYMEEGYLKFQFSCGYQTMLLSELKVPVNNGYPINIKAVLNFSKNMKHCYASIKINNTLSMAGDQIADVSLFINPTAWVHLGTIPQGLIRERFPVNGFIGCMSTLKISGKRVELFKDAEDGYEVTECSSLACLSNPCGNGGSCTPMGDTWFCHCKNGYLGHKCEKSICDDNPCYYGGTCIPFSGSGYICLCPFGKHGHFCENDLRITEPYFSSSIRGLSSYVAYSIPDGISKNMEINFRFSPATMEQISLLLFIGQSGYHDYYADHVAVSFVKGYIMLTWNLGSGPRRIFTSQAIKKGARDYLVKLGHLGRRAWLYVENLGNVTGRSPGSLTKLDVVPLLYLGGHDSTNFSLLPHDLPLHTGFSGCIFDVELKSGSVVVPLQSGGQSSGRAVGQCGTTECFDQSCQNGGACLHHGSTFMCLCQDNWYDPLCSSKHNLCQENTTKCSEDSTCVPLISNYNCDCPFGRTGEFCQKQEVISDVSLSGRRSFILLHPREFEDSRVSFSIQLRVLSNNGLIFFIGSRGTSFLSLYLQDNLVEMRINSNRNSLLSIRNSKLLLKGIWYQLEFGLFGRKVYLSINNVVNTGLSSIGSLFALSKEDIFLGGLPDMSSLPLKATPNFPVPLNGCIRHFHIDSKHIPLNFESIKNSRNVVDCDGTPCGGESCLNGGTCWLDSFSKPRCSCTQPYYGKRCEIIPNCEEKGCLNNGTCTKSRCSCAVGYSGAFCEQQIKILVPKFNGMGYLKIKKQVDKRRALRDFNIRRLYLNFTTAKMDGLLIWSQKDKNYIGLGIENGYLKLIYQDQKVSNEFVEFPSSVQISDGLFHTVEVRFSPISIKLDTQDLTIRNNSLDMTTDGVFFIGGLPTANNLFPENFQGCIQSFSTNDDNTITDFTEYEGRDIGTCDII